MNGTHSVARPCPPRPSLLRHAKRPTYAAKILPAGVFYLATLGIAAVPAAAQSDIRVKANYEIAFAGFSIGAFNFKSEVADRRYTLTSRAKVKVLFGAFKWSSTSKTEGFLAGEAQPQTFDFDYKIKKKRKRSTITFARGNVVKLENEPPLRPSKKRVPLTREHLLGVIDPMTAIMRMTAPPDGRICRSTHEIFDGRSRIRLSLSPKGRRRIAERRPSGQPGFGYVCRVRFTPVAGHKREKGINFIAGNGGIEIVLRPVPAANILVPYQILVPTLLGTVAITARKVEIVNAKRRIALVY